MDILGYRLSTLETAESYLGTILKVVDRVEETPLYFKMI